MSFSESLNNTIIQPWFNDTGYNLVNTTVYAIIFIAFMFFVFSFIQKKKINMDLNFILGWSGWIVAASAIRVLEDVGIYDTIWAVTPGLAVVICGSAFFTLVISKYLENLYGISYNSIWLPSGFLISLFNIVRIPFVNLSGFLYFVVIFAICLFAVLSVRKSFPKLLTDINVIVLMSQLFDATATFVGINYFGFVEKHVLPLFLINIFGPAIMFPLKISVVLVALYFIDLYSDTEEEKKFFKLVIFTLGLITGLRDLLQIISF
ncbi:MAG: DUF63 family protein [DPANN group archaeon]|nr:DUF63 family protein [DPANN group archaeon]